MVASFGFKKQLWALDPELDVVWDWVSQRWEIWRFPGQANVKKKVWNEGAHHVMRIETKDKKFRDLGADILLKLQMGDTHKFSTKQLVDYFDQLDRNLAREKQKKIENMISAMNKEMLEYTGSRKIAVSSKYNFETDQSIRVKRAIAGGL